jgi:ppGpp synthetase/RelA/SpoT-type nucleotidyltranferase
MPALTPYEEAQKYINNNTERYLHLLDIVRAACKRIESSDRQHVKSVYSRGEKQKNKYELKETWKLPKKLLKMRQEQERPAAGKGKRSAAKKTWFDIPDVIGVTIVVFYPDQIKSILRRVVHELNSQKIVLDEPIRIKTEFGYHADHAVFVSRGSTQHRGLRCEVQCKTMLHDAWATKMHDLTYKPIGYLEPRLELLMQAFGDTLERVERQSEAIRDMILEKWNAESERRRLTHGMLFLRLEEANFRRSSSKPAKQIRALVEEHRDDIKLAANADDKIIESICEKIDDLCSTDLREGWVLAALLASFRPKPDLVSFLAQHAEAFLEHASHESNRKESNNRILSVPLAYVAAGNMDLAVNAYVKLLAAPKVYGLSAEQIRLCKFNHANAMVERHYYDPDESRDGAADELRKRVEELLQASSASRRIGATRLDRELEEASTKDTNGFMKIVFASKPEHAKEVSAGIDLCNDARLVAKKHKFDLGEQYCDLHLRLGWRRLMELESNRP